MQIFESLARFHQTQAALNDHCTRLRAALRDDDGASLDQLNAETAEYAREMSEAAMGIVEVLHSRVDPPAWRQFAKAVATQAETDPTGTIRSLAEVVAAVEGAQLIYTLATRA